MNGLKSLSKRHTYLLSLILSGIALYHHDIIAIIYLVLGLVDVELVSVFIGRRGNLHCQHVFAVSVLVVGNVDDVMEGVACKDSLFTNVHFLRSVLRYGEQSFVRF